MPRQASPSSSWPGTSKHRLTSFGGLSRSHLMSRIRSVANKTTELTMVRLLRKASLSGWKRHLPLAGRPDFAWPRERVAVFVDGCFWHGHTACGKNATPKANASLWRQKIKRNRRRDRWVARSFRSEGWTVLRFWECSLAKRPEASARRLRRTLLED